MRPIQSAAVISSTFLVFSVVYILMSDWAAIQLASNAAELNSIQSAKGVFYVGIVSVILFLLTFSLLRHIDLQNAQLQKERETMLTVERSTLAGTLAASMAHDLNNLVGAIRTNLEFVLQDQGIPSASREALEDVHRATEELLDLNETFRSSAIAKTDEHRDRGQLSTTVRKAVELIRTHSKLQDREIEVELESRIDPEIYPQLITHAVINLLLNAADATEPGGTIRIRTRDEDRVCILSVEDDGPGIPPEERQNVLKPFHTNKPTGSGLGLFSVAYCADEHHCGLVIEDSDLGGASMRLEFQPADDTSSPSRPSLLPSSRGQTPVRPGATTPSSA